MVDFNYINGRMLIGGHIHNKQEFDEMCNLGVTHFVCLLAPNETLHDVQYNVENRAEILCVETWDDHKEKPLDWTRAILKFTLNALSDHKNKVYIHCAAGRSRSAVAWYTVLKAMGYNESSAQEMIKSVRPSVDFWPDYIQSANKNLKNLGFL